MATEYLTSMTLDYAQIERDLKECDIVEFNRLSYSHYAFYIGDGLFVHVTGDPDKGQGGAKAIKCVQTLRDIAAFEGMRPPCRINNLEAARFWQDIGSSVGLGVLFPLPLKKNPLQIDKVKTARRSVSDAKRRALEGIKRGSNGEPLLGIENGVTVPYNLLGWNCERYCTHWRYDCEGFSQQAYNGVVNETLGNAQRFMDTSAAGCFDAMDKAPVPLKPVCAVAGGVVKVGAVAVGTGKAVFDGATSLLFGAGMKTIKDIADSAVICKTIVSTAIPSSTGVIEISRSNNK